LASLEKYYKPWTLSWIIQQGLLVLKQGRLGQVSIKTLWLDFLSFREANKRMKETSNGFAETKKPDHYPRIVTCHDVPLGELSALNQYFDQVYVINLVRRQDRREEMMKKLTGLNIKAEFYPAEDGQSEENLREFNEYYNSPIDPQNAHEMEIKLKRKVIVSPGAWGILKTYRSLIREAQGRGFEKILCFEDDVIFAKNFEKLFIQATDVISEDWKIIYLGASQYTWKENVDLIIPERVFKDSHTVRYYYPLNTYGAFALGLRNTSFSLILSESDEMKCPIDAGILQKVSNRFIGDCFVLVPNLVIADVRNSDIRVKRKQINFAKMVRWDLSLYDTF